MGRSSTAYVPRLVAASLLVLLFCLVPIKGDCQRVLVVTTDQTPTNQAAPVMYDSANGCFVVTDLVAAGYPFDVVTHSRFISMDLTGHDVIILCGITTPVSVADVAAKCQTAVQQGRKVFINGTYPYSRYDYTTGQAVETNYFCNSLFGVSFPLKDYCVGSVTVPSAIEKDPAITAIGVPSRVYFYYFTFTTNPPLKIMAGGRAIGFVGPTGGAIESTQEYSLSLIDYGKLVTYLRYGDSSGIGFANDRMDGAPIAAFEMHCDMTSQINEIQAVDAMLQDVQMPLDALLIYRKLGPASVAYYNSITDPLIKIGSHTRTHPNDWPLVPDVLSETSGVLADQALVIPNTKNYLNFSGNMNPTTSQIDQIYSSGVVFGASGSSQRSVHTTTNDYVPVQREPTTRIWLVNLSKSTSTPYCLSQTIACDNTFIGTGSSYVSEVETNYLANVKYGLYTYGFFHDYSFDAQLHYSSAGMLLSDQIHTAFSYLKSQGAKFIFVDELIGRLRDYMTGSITRVANPDGSTTVTVTRPNAKANDLKIGCRGLLSPVASGSAIVSQHTIGDCLYLTLRPETTSTFTVSWLWIPPVPPVVTAPAGYITEWPSVASDAQWHETFRPASIAEYQYAVGTSPGASDAQGWASAGTDTSASVDGANLIHGNTYYVSVRARYTGGDWSTPGASSALVADLTPPKTPTVYDDGGVQQSPFQLHAHWTSSDPESGVFEYQYAVGTAPGTANVVGWTVTTGTDVTLTDLSLTRGVTYYWSERACNSVWLWSAVGVSDGIEIEATLGVSKNYADGTSVSIRDAVVTRAFSGEFYVEALDRSAAIKIVSSTPVVEGQILQLTGTMSHTAVERYLNNPTISSTGTATIRPICIPTRALAGTTWGMVQGASGGQGLNNVGMLVCVLGKITSVASDQIIVDDGASSLDWTHQPGVLVRVTPPHTFAVGSPVKVVGISTLDNSDPGHFERSVRIKTNSDVQILSQ